MSLPSDKEFKDVIGRKPNPIDLIGLLVSSYVVTAKRMEEAGNDYGADIYRDVAKDLLTLMKRFKTKK